MNRLQTHFRNTLVTGLLAAGPLVVVVYGAVWLETNARPLANPLGIYFPGMGILVAIVAVYVLGLIVKSLAGRWILGLADKALQRVPGLNLLYRSWKDVLVQPAGREGIFHQAVWVPGPEGGAQLGFCCGAALPNDPAAVCVFLPGTPNPLLGRLVFVPASSCRPAPVSTEDAFKFLLSSGNYLPEGLQPLSPSALDEMAAGKSSTH